MAVITPRIIESMGKDQLIKIAHLILIGTTTKGEYVGVFVKKTGKHIKTVSDLEVFYKKKTGCKLKF